ncbi:hypothetical protein ABT075_38410 [Streptomyces sp. NPDC002677]|uniref:hypothetical protein n=1 Tax=Streptomyces sp. NPDC002677 TaxID=3154774 RepID=UPI003334978A
MSSPQPRQTSPKELRRIIAASSTGTLIEWYDFFVYGSLAVVFSGFFFPTGQSSLALLVSVAAFGTGFVVRLLLAGLTYPTAVAALSTVVSLALLRGGRDNKLVRAVWSQPGTPDRADSPAPAPTG